MPDSEVIKTDLGFFIKNKTIETYSYVVPTLEGDKEFEQFLDNAYSFFSGGKDYFIVKLYHNENYAKNSKILRQRKLIQYHLDTSLMVWDENNNNKLESNSLVELELLTLKKTGRWISVFFDSFNYPLSLKKYITSMVKLQLDNGIEFFVGQVAGKDVSCFCSFKDENYYGIYGVGTKQRFRRRGYAQTMMTNFIEDKLQTSANAQFCLQAQTGSGAELLYLNLGFDNPFIQKRFDWDPSTSNVLL